MYFIEDSEFDVRLLFSLPSENGGEGKNIEVPGDVIINDLSLDTLRQYYFALDAKYNEAEVANTSSSISFMYNLDSLRIRKNFIKSVIDRREVNNV